MASLKATPHRPHVGGEVQIILGEREIDAQGYIKPKAKVRRKSSFRQRQGDQAAVTVEEAAMSEVRFVRDIQPLSPRRVATPAPATARPRQEWFQALPARLRSRLRLRRARHRCFSRRFNRVNVDDSLMLLKPLGEVRTKAAGNQARLREHQLIRQWILEGTKLDSVATGRARSIEILPRNRDGPRGRSQQFLVIAHYADGSTAT